MMLEDSAKTARFVQLLFLLVKLVRLGLSELAGREAPTVCGNLPCYPIRL